MKAQEFRLNNWIEYDNRFFQIDSIAEVFPTLNTVEFGIGVVDWNNIKPIPLTEELLFKCGFEVDTYNYFSISGMPFDILFDEWFCVLQIGRIDYVHQLQNLYFALTGKELTIKIK